MRIGWAIKSVIYDRAASVTSWRHLEDHYYHGTFSCGHGPVPTKHVPIQSAIVRRNGWGNGRGGGGLLRESEDGEGEAVWDCCPFGKEDNGNFGNPDCLTLLVAASLHVAPKWLHFFFFSVFFFE